MGKWLLKLLSTLVGQVRQRSPQYCAFLPFQIIALLRAVELVRVSIAMVAVVAELGSAPEGSELAPGGAGL